MSKRLISSLVFAVIFIPSAAPAQSLLGILGGGDSSGGGLLDSVGNAAGSLLAPVTGATSGGPVGLDVGGSGGLVSVGIGGSEPLASVSVLGPSGIADIDVNLGDVGAGVTVGGPDLIDVDIRLPRGADGGDGGNGGNGGGAGGGNNGNHGNNGSDGGYVVINRGGGGGGGGGVSFGSASTACANTNANQLVALFQQSRPATWRQARHIELVPLRVCREIRNQIGAWLAANPRYHSLVGSVARDQRIQSVLAGTQYQPGHVLGVQQQGSTLVVYVF